MARHPKAGKPVKVANGMYKGKYFIVIDYLVNQFQGKAIERIHKAHPALTTPVLRRGFPLDGDVVFGKLYPGMDHICMHDKELQVELNVVEETGEELPPNVEPMKPKKKKKKKETEDGPPTAS